MNRRQLLKLAGAALAAAPFAALAPAPVQAAPAVTSQLGGVVAAEAHAGPIREDTRFVMDTLRAQAEQYKSGLVSMKSYGCRTSPESKALLARYADWVKMSDLLATDTIKFETGPIYGVRFS